MAIAAGLLVWRGHRAGPVIALAPALWAVYMSAQLIVGQEYGRLPAIPRRLERTAGIVLVALAAFLAVGLHLPGLVDALSSQPTAVEHTSSPSAFWIVKLMDLGVIVPAALAIGVGLLRRAAWARKAGYALLGCYTLLGAAVAGMAIVMYANNDPDGALANVIAFTAFAAAFAALTLALYRPLFTAPGAVEHGKPPGLRAGPRRPGMTRAPGTWRRRR